MGSKNAFYGYHRQPSHRQRGQRVTAPHFIDACQLMLVPARREDRRESTSALESNLGPDPEGRHAAEAARLSQKNLGEGLSAVGATADAVSTAAGLAAGRLAANAAGAAAAAKIAAAAAAAAAATIATVAALVAAAAKAAAAAAAARAQVAAAAERARERAIKESIDRAGRIDRDTGRHNAERIERAERFSNVC